MTTEEQVRRVRWAWDSFVDEILRVFRLAGPRGESGPHPFSDFDDVKVIGPLGFARITVGWNHRLCHEHFADIGAARWHRCRAISAMGRIAK